MNNTTYFQCYFSPAISRGANIRALPLDWVNPYDQEVVLPSHDGDLYVGMETLSWDYALGPVTRYHLFDMKTEKRLRRAGLHIVLEKRSYLTSDSRGIIQIENAGNLRLTRNPESIVTALSLVETKYEAQDEIIFGPPKPDWQINYYGLIRLLIERSITQK